MGKKTSAKSMTKGRDNSTENDCKWQHKGNSVMRNGIEFQINADVYKLKDCALYVLLRTRLITLA